MADTSSTDKDSGPKDTSATTTTDATTAAASAATTTDATPADAAAAKTTTTMTAPTALTAPTDEESKSTAPQVDGAPESMGGRQLNELNEPEYDVEITLADQQADPNNPLYSVKAFDQLNLPESILKGIYAMNFHKPSKIQERALPLLIQNPPRNLIGQSQSGTGKTAAFVLNILNRVDLAQKVPQALVLAPSRELARQIIGVITLMGEFMGGLTVSAAIPDPSRRGMKVEGHVVVGTPGTTMDMLRRRLLDKTHIKVLVLDEADNMLDQQGLGDQCKRVKGLLLPTVQITLFSATFPENVLRFARQFAPEANQITLKHEELTVEGIKQFFFDCDSDETKYATLVKFYGLMTINSSIIFCKRRDTAIEIERRMTADGHQVAHLSGALEGVDRDAVIDRFRDGRAKVLITTNVIARGIDVSSVSLVVNYDIPEFANGRADPETYLHRIGRTGRFGRVGAAVSFISDQAGWQKLMEIQQHFGTHIEPLSGKSWDEVEDTLKRILKNPRSGKTTKQMTEGTMETDGGGAAA